MKFSIYNIIIERENELIIYNSRRSSYVKINKEPEYTEFIELQNSKSLDKDNYLVKALYERGFIVDKNFNEYQDAQNMIKNYYINQQKTLQLMIYTTEQCNFRCVYCPEKHVSKKLSLEKWDSLYKHIEKNVVNGNYEEIFISFFGGEPLLEFKNIAYFLNKITLLKNKYSALKFEGDITTNGYLLTPKVLNTLISHGVKKFQITLDGFAETHNKMRPRVDGEGTWDTIVENLKYINKIDSKIEVILRTNYNNMNESFMNDFYDWLESNFNKDIFSFLFHPISKFNENVDDNLVADTNSAISIQVRERLVENKLDNSYNAKNVMTPLALACKCAKPSYYTYTTEGNLTKCEQDYEKRGVIGYIDLDGDIIYTKKAEQWLNTIELDECRTCQLYPICAAKACPVKHPSLYCDTIRSNFDNLILEQISKGNIL